MLLLISMQLYVNHWYHYYQLTIPMNLKRVYECHLNSKMRTSVCICVYTALYL